MLLRIVIRYKNKTKCLLHRSIHNLWNDHLTGGRLFGFFIRLVNNTFNKPKHFNKGIHVAFLERKQKPSPRKSVSFGECDIVEGLALPY